MGGTPGNEYNSLVEGKVGAAAQGPAFSPSTKDEEEPGAEGGGAADETCGANGVAPASDAAMA
jgi:hypothetical protein